MKSPIAFLAGALLTGLLPLAWSTSTPEVPPEGVDAGSWVPISESLGLVIVRNSTAEGVIVPAAARRPLVGHFIVKHSGKWQRLVVVEPRAGFGDSL